MVTKADLQDFLVMPVMPLATNSKKELIFNTSFILPFPGVSVHEFNSIWISFKFNAKEIVNRSK